MIEDKRKEYLTYQEYIAPVITGIVVEKGGNDGRID